MFSNLLQSLKLQGQHDALQASLLAVSMHVYEFLVRKHTFPTLFLINGSCVIQALFSVFSRFLAPEIPRRNKCYASNSKLLQGSFKRLYTILHTNILPLCKPNFFHTISLSLRTQNLILMFRVLTRKCFNRVLRNRFLKSERKMHSGSLLPTLLA